MNVDTEKVKRTSCDDIGKLNLDELKLWDKLNNPTDAPQDSAYDFENRFPPNGVEYELKKAHLMDAAERKNKNSW